MSAKVFTYGYQEAQTILLFVQRQADGLFLQADGTFGAGASSPFPFTEIFQGFYQVSTDVAPWGDGFFNVLIAKPDGGDYWGLEAYVQRISGETQIGFIEASSITSRNAVTSIRTQQQSTQASLDSLAAQVGVLSDRIDSLQQILSRRDYRA